MQTTEHPAAVTTTTLAPTTTAPVHAHKVAVNNGTAKPLQVELGKSPTQLPNLMAPADLVADGLYPRLIGIGE